MFDYAAIVFYLKIPFLANYEPIPSKGIPGYGSSYWYVEAASGGS